MSICTTRNVVRWLLLKYLERSLRTACYLGFQKVVQAILSIYNEEWNESTYLFLSTTLQVIIMTLKLAAFVRAEFRHVFDNLVKTGTLYFIAYHYLWLHSIVLRMQTLIKCLVPVSAQLVGFLSVYFNKCQFISWTGIKGVDNLLSTIWNQWTKKNYKDDISAKCVCNIFGKTSKFCNHDLKCRSIFCARRLVGYA